MNKYYEYKSMRAKNGFASKKKELLESYRLAYTLYEHSIITCCVSENPPIEWIKDQEECEQKVKSIESELKNILK